MEINRLVLDEVIKNALGEDIGAGDVTTLSIIPPPTMAKGVIHVKEKGVLAGIFVAERVFTLLDTSIIFRAEKKDGEEVSPGDIIAHVEGPASSILTGERVALNFLQHLSGIATKTANLAGLLKFYKAVLVDTRKTVPGMRLLEKYAVRAGGGTNHRMGLYDAVLIKDNHIKVAGGIQKAVAMARNKIPHTMKIEVEVENLEQLNDALETKADIIMLDNMDVEMVKEAVKIIDGQAIVEVSGGLTEEKIVEMAKAGVDLISVGALTHSVKALDISLDIGEIKGVL